MLGTGKALPSLASGLSARLLLLTIGFVMLAEVLIFAPSIGRFRLTYLEERLAAGHLAILALEATPDHMVSPELTMELLTHVEAVSVALTKPGVGKLMLMDMPPDHIDATYDLREATFLGLIRDAFAVLWGKPMRIIRVLGPRPAIPGTIHDPRYQIADQIAMRDDDFMFVASTCRSQVLGED